MYFIFKSDIFKVLNGIFYVFYGKFMKWDFEHILPLTNNVYTFWPAGGQDVFFRTGVITFSKLRPEVHNGSLPYFTLNIVLHGSAKFRGEDGTEYLLKPGSLFVRAPQSNFDIIRAKDYAEFAFAAYPGFYDFIKHADLFKAIEKTCNTVLDAALVKKLKNYINDIHNASPAMTYEVVKSTLEFFRELECRYLQSAGGLRLEFRMKSAELLRQAASKPENIPQVAAKMNMGYESFRKKFTAEFGISPKQFLLEYRLRLAGSELLSGKSISVVADKFDYNDAAAFSKIFKRFMGISPSKFKKSFSQNQ